MENKEKNIIESRLKELMQDGLIKHVKMFDDSSVEIKYAIDYDMATTPFKSNYTPDNEAYQIILSLFGPLKPGDLKLCTAVKQSKQDLEIQRLLKPASIAFGIENGDVKKVTRMEDGGICLWMFYDHEKPSKELFFTSDAPHIDTILKYTGPLEPGETYVFDRLR